MEISKEFSDLFQFSVTVLILYFHVFFFGWVFEYFYLNNNIQLHWLVISILHITYIGFCYSHPFKKLIIQPRWQGTCLYITAYVLLKSSQTTHQHYSNSYFRRKSACSFYNFSIFSLFLFFSLFCFVCMTKDYQVEYRVKSEIIAFCTIKIIDRGKRGIGHHNKKMY